MPFLQGPLCRSFGWPGYSKFIFWMIQGNCKGVSSLDTSVQVADRNYFCIRILLRLNAVIYGNIEKGARHIACVSTINKYWKVHLKQHSGITSLPVGLGSRHSLAGASDPGSLAGFSQEATVTSRFDWGWIYFFVSCCTEGLSFLLIVGSYQGQLISQQLASVGANTWEG